MSRRNRMSRIRPVLMGITMAGLGLSSVALTAKSTSEFNEKPNPANFESRVLFDFNSESAARDWITVNDGVMGGLSEGGPEFLGKTVLFTGTTNTNGGGFSSIRTRELDMDLSRADGLLIRVRGDGRSYLSRLRTDESVGWRRVAYQTTFETPEDGSWIEIHIPFTEYNATVFGRDVSAMAEDLNTGKLKSLGFMIYDLKDGPFELEIDWVKAYKGEPLPADHNETL